VSGADVTLEVRRHALLAPGAAGGQSEAGGGEGAASELPAVTAVVNAVALLRRHAAAAPFAAAAAAVTSGSGSGGGGGGTPPLPPAFVVSLYRGAPIAVVPRDGKLTVTFALAYADATDRALARAVAGELAEAQRSGVATGHAPSVVFAERDSALPADLRALLAQGYATGAAVPPQPDRVVGFLSLALTARQLAPGPRLEAALDVLTGVPAFFAFHVAATKAQLHARMRRRGDGWLQVLHRAERVPPPPPPPTTTTTTMTTAAALPSGGAGGGDQPAAQPPARRAVTMSGRAFTPKVPA
jgi:hypothetical protein